MSKLTAVIIAKNEEKMITGALESLSFADEILVINNGSTDKTLEIAEKLKAKIVDINTTDFSEMRNLGLKNASYDWILYLDADERVDEKLKENLKKIIIDTSEFAAFKLNRKNYYLGKNEWPSNEKLERLFKKENLKGWSGQIHESPKVEGKIGELEGFILHFTHRDLESMLDKTISWSETEAMLRFNTNHPKMTWWRFPRVMITAFFNSYILQRGFKAGSVGLIESMYQAFSMFITYAKLWELQQNDKLKPIK